MKNRAKPADASDPELLEYYRTHFIEFCRECLVIVTKKGKRLPLHLNSTQLKVLEVIRSLMRAGVPPRLVVLKARQVGISTLVEALLFHACLCNPDQSALVIAHNLKSSRILFRMGRGFHRWLPVPMQQRKRVDNRHEIEFDNLSRMQIEVQGDPRGYTAQRVHLSEFAFYDQPDDTLVAVMQTLPHQVDSLCVIESTAKGVGSKFHKLWQRAEGLAMDEEVPEDERGWTPVFVPWFQHQEYRISTFGETFKPTSDERHMMRTYGIDEDQLKWRRWCINANLDGDEEKFAQEYPATAEEAFSLSGRPAFDTKSVHYYTTQIAEAVRKRALPHRMEIESDPPGIGPPQLIDYDRGRLRIFAPRHPRHTYIAGVDPSEGDPGSDPSPIAVLDQMTLDLVATWYGKAPPDVLACHTVDLARHYNEALIINEANNHGILFHETVMQLGYPNLYFRKVTEDTVAMQITEKPGYLSTRRNREHLFNTLRKYVRMRMGKVPCPHVVQQMQSLVYVDEKAQAQPGAEKDLLIAFALCLMAHRGSMQLPLEPHPEETIRAVAQEGALIRERDPVAADKYSFDRTGLTMEECLRREDAILAREKRQRSFGLGGMR